VGEVQDVHHPENKSEARGDKKEKSRVGQTMKKKYGNAAHLISFLAVASTVEPASNTL
jgi:hypothetical protein